MPVKAGIPTGKYKKLLLSETGVLQEIPRISSQLMELENLTKSGELQIYEVLTLFILIFVRSRSARVVGCSPGERIDGREGIHSSSKSIESLPENLKPLFTGGVNCSTIYEYINKYRILKLPGEIQEFLKILPVNNYNILLTDRELDPEDMLKLQSEGRRAVTLSFANALSGRFIHARDAFEFLLHDVSHAYTFFSNIYLHKEQVDFFKKLRRYGKLFDPYKKINNFIIKFNYLISDMNSHPEHLNAYLLAILREAKNSQR